MLQQVFSNRRRSGPARRCRAWAAVCARAAAAFLLGALLVPAGAALPASPAHADSHDYGYGTVQGGEVHIPIKDHQFKPAVVRIPPGMTVVWTNTGHVVHTVSADDGSWNSGNLERGDTFRHTFTAPGRYMYHCTPHGAAGGHGMAGMVLVGDVAEESVKEPPKATRTGPPITIRVPEGAPTIQAAVDESAPGDLIVISPGVYHEAVVVLTPGITIRGLDRNQVILDGQFKLDNGIKILAAENVVVENLTVRHYNTNAVYWTGVQGYRGSYLTVYNNGDYGLYAFDSKYGQFDNSYGSGHPDSAFYIGQCQPCHALITDVIAEHNALGYSGTNAGGDLTIMNSVWRHNMSGIVPNTLDSQWLAPQAGTRIINNRVYGNNNAGAPFHKLIYPTLGTGIIVTGGNDNLIEGNLVEDHDNYGIAVLPNLDENFWTSGGNVVRNNTVRGSGRADLALGAPAMPGNCFEGNDAGTMHPVIAQWWAYGCGGAKRLGGGDLPVTLNLLALFLKAEFGTVPHNDYRTQPAPLPQPTMPDPFAPPAPAWPTPQSHLIPAAVTAPEAMAPAHSFSSYQLMGVAMVGSWWSALFGMYLYALPFVLYAAWVTLAVWDLFRRDDMLVVGKVAWLAVVLLVPLLGPVTYYVMGRSPIPSMLRWALVAGGAGAYLLLAVGSVLVGL